MAGAMPRVPEPYQGGRALVADDFHVSEFAADFAGAMSPFGPVEFPLPVERLSYRHPSPADRPNRAGE
jgi:hypothetical protein